MQERGTQQMMNYTTAPVGLRVEGQLWTGQLTEWTTTCPKCGRVGLISSQKVSQQIIVHTGRVNGQTLAGIDYCELGCRSNDQRSLQLAQGQIEHSAIATVLH